MDKFITYSAIALVIIIIALFAAKGSITGNAILQQNEPVTLKLKWFHQAQFAGNYVAAQKGFYADQGLDIKMEQFSFESPIIESVLSGKADFGIAGADELLLARSQGKPIKVVAVIYKTNPICAYTLKSSGITKPQDFVGKKVGVQPGTNVVIMYSVMMSRLGINRSLITEMPIGHDAKELLDGTVDVSTGYIMNEPQQAIESGKEINTMLMADYGANMYSDAIFTTENTIQTRPEFVKKFVTATLQGWQYAFENEDETVDIVMQYANSSTRVHQKNMFEQSLPLILRSNEQLGRMTSEDWLKVKKILVDQKILQNDIDVNTIYTNEFII